MCTLTFTIKPVVVEYRRQGERESYGYRKHSTNSEWAPYLGLSQVILFSKLPDIRTLSSLKLEEIFHGGDHSDNGVLVLLHIHNLNARVHNSPFKRNVIKDPPCGLSKHDT